MRYYSPRQDASRLEYVMPSDIEEMAILRLERQGETFRREGRLDEARETFERLLSITPGHLMAERFLASFAGRAVERPSSPGGLKPTPFVRHTDFLPRSLRDRLFDSLFANVHRFELAILNVFTNGVSLRQIVDGDARRGLLLRDCFRYFDRDLEHEFNHGLAASFGALVNRLGVPPFEPGGMEAHALIYRDGDFFRAHRDTFPGNTRRITFVYYLHDSPKRFTGGDLVLYDTYFRPEAVDPEEPGLKGSGCTRLSCVDNQIVFFPSEYYHEVLEVSGVGDDMRGARIAINGWFHTIRADGDDSRELLQRDSS